MIHAFLLLLASLFCFPVHFAETVYALSTQEKNVPQVLVIFGATGDLTKRKLIPALLELEKKGQLSDSFHCIGMGRREMSDDQFREHISEFVSEKDRAAWQKFKGKISYHRGSFEKNASYDSLYEKINGFKGGRLYYLATPASEFSPIIEKLSAHSFLEQSAYPARVIIEKPFGKDLDSAIQLQEEIGQYLLEEQIYRIDHFLGKPGIDNLMKFRFGSFDKFWNNRHIERVSITISEDIGVGSRGSFWEQTGLLRDLIQNHAMQILTLTAMEQPSAFSPREIQKEKVRLVESIRVEQAIRGQYGKGSVGGQEVPGYREEAGVPAESSVETYAEATLAIENSRWQGVPFTLKAGKRLQEKFTEVAIDFKSGSELAASGRLILRIQPKEEIYFQQGSEKTLLQKGESGAPEAYEKLLAEAMRGDASHYVTVDELMASWRLFTPILADWEAHRAEDFPNYSAGSAGPENTERD